MHIILLILTTKCLWNTLLILNHTRRASVFLIKEDLWGFLNYRRSSLQRKEIVQVQEAQVMG